MAELTKTLAVIQTELKAKKSSYNAFGKYYFRKAEDILEAAKPFLTKHNVYVKVDEEIISVDPVPMMQSTATISNGKDSITATATKKKITDAQMKKAVEFVSGGGDIKAILSKYTLTPAQLTELKKLTK
jgi:hypothetical protein